MSETNQSVIIDEFPTTMIEEDRFNKIDSKINWIPISQYANINKVFNFIDLDAIKYSESSSKNSSITRYFVGRIYEASTSTYYLGFAILNLNDTITGIKDTGHNFYYTPNGIDLKIETSGFDILDWSNNYYIVTDVPDRLPPFKDRIYDQNGHFVCIVEKWDSDTGKFRFYGLGYSTDDKPTYCSYVTRTNFEARSHRFGNNIKEKPSDVELGRFQFKYLIRPTEISMSYVTKEYYSDIQDNLKKCKTNLKQFDIENKFFKKRKSIKQISKFIKWGVLFFVLIMVSYFRAYSKGDYKTPGKHRVGSMAASMAFGFGQVVICFVLIFGLQLVMDLNTATSIGSIIWMIYIIFYVSATPCVKFASYNQPYNQPYNQ